MSDWTQSNVMLKPGDRFTISGLSDAELAAYQRNGFLVRDGMVHGVFGAVVTSAPKSLKAPPPS